jgi:hypothetical protein
MILAGKHGCIFSSTNSRHLKNLKNLNGGGEYESKEFATYCMQYRINRYFTTRYTPQ